ncbi:MAG: excisionase family DNA-binding protein [Sedimentisphaerales bacterium]|nr:excisionase family DNA-binding protein [Sedimentisphaerales bacterium]
MEKTTYISLEALAARLQLPKAYLRRLAAENQIPHLIVGGRYRFNPIAVQAALDRLAEKGGTNG